MLSEYLHSIVQSPKLRSYDAYIFNSNGVVLCLGLCPQNFVVNVNDVNHLMPDVDILDGIELGSWFHKLLV